MTRDETTKLSPSEEAAFRAWVRATGIKDVDHPASRYDYRGYWKEVASKGVDQRKEYADGPHFPDTYKQHGHETFSNESKYSRGPIDGGRWDGETYVPQKEHLRQATGMTMAVSHGDEELLKRALQALLSAGSRQ